MPAYKFVDEIRRLLADAHKLVEQNDQMTARNTRMLDEVRDLRARMDAIQRKLEDKTAPEGAAVAPRKPR